MRVEINRGQLANKFKKIDQLIDEAKNLALYEAASWVILRSPVDTGTYMDNWNIGLGNDVPVTGNQDSTNRPRKRDWTKHRDMAQDRTSAQIESLPEDWKRASLGNTSYHADEVEYTHEYFVLTSLRSAWPTLKAKAILEAEARFK